MDILPNSSLYIQIINFLITLFILNLILYRPVRKILNERKTKMDDYARVREDFETRAVHSGQKLQEQNDSAKQQGTQTKTSLVQEALTGQENLLQEAASAAQQKVEKDRTEINSQETAARRALEQELDLFSKALAEKILRRGLA